MFLGKDEKSKMCISWISDDKQSWDSTMSVFERSHFSQGKGLYNVNNSDNIKTPFKKKV